MLKMPLTKEEQVKRKLDFWLDLHILVSSSHKTNGCLVICYNYNEHTQTKWHTDVVSIRQVLRTLGYKIIKITDFIDNIETKETWIETNVPHDLYEIAYPFYTKYIDDIVEEWNPPDSESEAEESQEHPIEQIRDLDDPI